MDEWVRTYLELKHGLVGLKGDVQTLALGSSHGEYAFDPRLYREGFNLCTVSQSLYYSFKLYEWATKQCPNLCEVILFYSSFSPGFDLSKQNDRRMADGFDQVFGIGRPDASGPSPARPVTAPLEYRPQNANLRGYLKSKSLIFMPATETGRSRADSHLKYSELSYPDAPQNAYVQAMIDMSKLRGDKMVIVTLPAKAEYYAAMPGWDDLFSSIRAMARNADISLVDLYGDPDFLDDDFGDVDHLHPLGAGPTKVADKIIARAGIRKPCTGAVDH